jgi:hypothetical protein
MEGFFLVDLSVVVPVEGPLSFLAVVRSFFLVVMWFV